MKFGFNNIKNLFDKIINGEESLHSKEDVVIEEELHDEVEEDDIFTDVSDFDIEDLINGFRNSDYSSRNMGILLRNLFIVSKPLYERFLNYVKSSLIVKNGVYVYTGRPLDFYKVNAISYMFTKCDKDKLNSGYYDSLLEDVVNGQNSYDLEFNYYYEFLESLKNNTNLERLEDYLVAFKGCYTSGSKDNTIDNMRKLIILIVKNKLEIKATRDSSYFVNSNPPSINLDTTFSSYGLFHELGHAIDFLIIGYKNRKKPEQLFQSAREKIVHSEDSFVILTQINKKIYEMKNQIFKSFYDDLRREYGLKTESENCDKYIESISLKVKELIKDDNVEKILDEYNISEDLSKNICEHARNHFYDEKVLASMIFQGILDNIQDIFFDSLPEQLLLDIITSIFGKYDINYGRGITISLKAGHSKKYYDSFKESNLTEIFANINALRVHGRTDLLDMLKKMIGQDLFDYFMNEQNINRLNEGYDQSINTNMSMS